MRSDFFRKENGLLVKPAGISKWRVSWSLENVLEGFKEFILIHGHYPNQEEIDEYQFLPSIKTIERKFGGIVKIRSLLGLTEIDLSRGQNRSTIAAKIGERGFELEESTYRLLVERFHEPFVHKESRITINNERRSVRVDFLVFHKKGKFAVDVFYPKEGSRSLANNVAVKYRVYKNFPFLVYVVVGNPIFNESQLAMNNHAAVKERNKNVILITIKSFISEIGELQPLREPYLG